MTPTTHWEGGGRRTKSRIASVLWPLDCCGCS